MQDIAYKIWKKLVNNKEKIVLFIMVIVTAYHLFQMFQPVEPLDNTRIDGPTPGVPTIDSPPPPPLIDIAENYNALVRQNFFWAHSERRSASGTETTDIDVQFLDIQGTAGEYRVQLRTTSATDWYVEGAKFEDFELLEINPEQQTIVVYTTKGTRQVTIPLEQ